MVALGSYNVRPIIGEQHLHGSRLTMRLSAVVMLLCCVLSAPALAADLVIGRASEHFSADPQFAESGNNINTATDMFDSLVASDANNQPVPALAVSWQAVDPLTWQIKLRPNVTFGDGSHFTAEDVAFSLKRVKTITNSPAPYSAASRNVASVDVIDPLTVQVKTSTPMPLLVEQIGDVFILSAKAAQGLDSTAMNAGKGMVGTGPYIFQRWAPGQLLEMKANPAYWGGKPAWDKVTLKFIPSAASRVAALLSGDVDLIDQLAPADAKQLGATTKATLFSIASSRLVYLALDSGRGQTPFITDTAGAKLDRNPLQDPRVRLAISKSIDRNALANRLLDGSAEPAGQMVPQGMGGFDPSLPPPQFDPAEAKQLLTEAGYPKGFGLTLHSSSDRLPQDSAVAQALGQMLRRGGFTVNGVVPLPYNSYAPAAGRQEYSVFLFSIGTPTSNSSPTLTSVLASYDPAHGMGAFNRARYSNPVFDTVLRQAMGEFDETKRDALLAQATHIAMADTALAPLYWQVVHWGARKGIDYTPRRDEITAGRYARPF
jgi:peptide/nickel transport system substrate-binding protein